MIGFSIMMWFCSALLILFGISLSKGNYSGMHGKVFDHAEDKKGYAKAVGKPVLLMGTGIAAAGILAIVIRGFCAVIVSFIFLLLVMMIAGLWFDKVQERFKNF